MSDAFQTHGAFSWSELHAADVKGARRFYTDVIGWDLEEMDIGGGPYTVLKAGDQKVGGIMESRNGQGGSASWVTYVTVDDVDLRVGKTKDAGGQVLSPPMDVPGVGRMATIADPAGAAICLITYAPQGS